MFPDSTYSMGSLVLEPGEIVVYYSDGISEAQSSSGVEFGEERLTTLVEGARERSPRDIVELVNTEVNNHCKGTAQQDDITIVILKRTS